MVVKDSAFCFAIKSSHFFCLNNHIVLCTQGRGNGHLAGIIRCLVSLLDKCILHLCSRPPQHEIFCFGQSQIIYRYRPGWRKALKHLGTPLSTYGCVCVCVCVWVCMIHSSFSQWNPFIHSISPCSAYHGLGTSARLSGWSCKHEGHRPCPKGTNVSIQIQTRQPGRFSCVPSKPKAQCLRNIQSHLSKSQSVQWVPCEIQ